MPYARVIKYQLGFEHGCGSSLSWYLILRMKQCGSVPPDLPFMEGLNEPLLTPCNYDLKPFLTPVNRLFILLLIVNAHFGMLVFSGDVKGEVIIEELAWGGGSSPAQVSGPTPDACPHPSLQLIVVSGYFPHKLQTRNHQQLFLSASVPKSLSRLKAQLPPLSWNQPSTHSSLSRSPLTWATVHLSCSYFCPWKGTCILFSKRVEKSIGRWDDPSRDFRWIRWNRVLGVTQFSTHWFGWSVLSVDVRSRGGGIIHHL